MKIDKNIPIPDRRAGKPRKYGIVDNMEVGDSIFTSSRSEISGLYNRSKYLGYVPVIRKLHNGFRIWRTK